MNAAQEFLEKVHTTERNGRSFNDAWDTCARQCPALYERMMREGGGVKPLASFANTAPPGDKVAAQMEFKNEVSNRIRAGADYETAWNRTKAIKPELYARAFPTFTNVAASAKLPPGVEASADGQKLIDGHAWPQPPKALLALGLPLNCTREQFDIWTAAEKFDVAKLPPEGACYLLRCLIQSGQLSSGQHFDEGYKWSEVALPDLFKLARGAM